MERTVCDRKRAQLRELCLFCQALGAEAQYHPPKCYFTVMFGDGWGTDGSEAAALAVQQEIQQEVSQYPDLVCYCFDPFSTLIYAI